MTKPPQPPKNFFPAHVVEYLYQGKHHFAYLVPDEPGNAADHLAALRRNGRYVGDCATSFAIEPELRQKIWPIVTEPENETDTKR